ncbi:class I SAM-dependent methyltransferase [Mycobacterium sp. 2YAF39]|uniref:class I SAM-dependent methyltransferase n=1 Tax=Mycobacterium sp. 2YAF39 TaxID=3233033 RepID=UPI003F9E6239
MVAADMFDYDAELRRYHARLLDAVDIHRDDRVLDIGCGTGQTTRAAARAASGGDALGIDISQPMLERARHLTKAEGLANASFELGDAQVYPLPEERFTIGLSRFGTMFFADPRAAFANVARALRPGARFVQLVWQGGDRQEWRAAVQLALADELDAPPTPAARGAFSLADPANVHAILDGAGFVDVQLVEVCEPVYYGADPASALHAIRSLRAPRDPRDDLDDASTDRALGGLRSIIRAREEGGVWFDSCAWLVTARRG